MARAANDVDVDYDDGGGGNPAPSRGCLRRRDPRLRDLGISCMLNTEVGALLAVIRRPPEAGIGPALAGGVLIESESHSSPIVHSLQSLRSHIFHPRRGSWRSTDPAVYLSPFLNVVQSDDVPAAATAAALSAVLKIVRLDIFGDVTPGAREVIHAVVFSVTNCRLEHTEPASEEAVLMRILQVLTAVMRSHASNLLTDHAVCTVVNSCYQVVQQSAARSDLLQRSARHTMHDLVQAMYSRLPDMRSSDGGPVDPGSEAEDSALHLSYTAQCMVDIFHFLCSLLNAAESTSAAAVDASAATSDEDGQLFALVLINSAVELGGDSIARHPGFLHIIQDDLFHHLIHYGTRSSPLVLSMICSTALNLYHFLRRSLRLQLEAFFVYVLLKITRGGFVSQLQEVATEGIISFCRQPSFVMEMYVNYDCDPIRLNVFEEIGKLLCKMAFPTAATPMSSMQVQVFEGLTTIIHNIADGIEADRTPALDAYHIDDSEFRPFWFERCDVHKDPDSWVDFVRMRKLKKKKVMLAANHFNRDEKKGMDFLNICKLVPRPPDCKSLACFFRYTPGLDKNKIGDYLGDPDELNIKVLKEFTDTFNFTGIILDTALRTFLETFRLPGESQKIQRILEAFSERFYEQQSSEIFISKDAVFILCYSLIMLNTDQHNPQVKKKMTEEEFIKNNRAINGGMDLPREYLSELFHSISTNAITLFGSTGAVPEFNSNLWADLMKLSRVVEPFILCNYKHKLSREVFVTIAGPSVATLSAIFEHTDDGDVLQECVRGLISIARIARYGLEDILDELLSCFCKFTTLLNPYATAEETVFSFTNEVKPRMATLAAFTIANEFGDSIKGAWRNMVDCLLKLKRLRLLPPTLLDGGRTEEACDDDGARHSKSESGCGVIFPSSHPGSGARNVSGLIGRFTQFLSLDTGVDSMLNVGTDMEKNLKIIQQCHIGSIFKETTRLPQEALQNLGRALIFAAAGKGQKFSTPVEEEETVGFCWDVIVVITTANLHRFTGFWPQFHETLAVVSQFPLFSPCPFAEKAIVSLMRVAVRMLSEPPRLDRHPEELVFKSINLSWKLDKEIVDACSESVAEMTVKILKEHAKSVQTGLGWKTLMHLLSVTGRHPENFDRGVEALMLLMANVGHITRNNYAYCIEAAFGFAALKISPMDTSSRILDLMADSVKWLIQWQRCGFSDPGCSQISSSSSMEDVSKSAGGHGNMVGNLFMKLAEALRKTSLVRREEIRNQAVAALGRCFLSSADELEWTSGSCVASFNLVIFAMVDDLHEKMVEYSRREGMEREMRSMEGTLKMAVEQMVEVYLKFMGRLTAAGPGFRTFWLGLLRRMDTCMKASLGEEGMPSKVMQELVPGLLKRMIVEMKEKEVLAQRDGDELWEITNIQIQWIAPSVKDELFPDG